MSRTNELVRRLLACEFTCEAGPLRSSVDFEELGELAAHLEKRRRELEADLPGGAAVSRVDELPRFTAIDWHRCEDDPEGYMCRHEDAERVIRRLASDRAALLAIVREYERTWNRAGLCYAAHVTVEALPEALRKEVTGG